jgi:putative peptidoglycan lipid II flippase
MLAIQLPRARALLSPAARSEGSRIHLREVVTSWVPAFVSRGVMQISAYVDSLIASLLPTGALAALTYSQAISVLPASLFGLSVSAAELPALSGETGDTEAMRRRIDAALARIAFFVVPSAAGFLFLGDVIVGAIYQTGRFGRGETLYVWSILAGSSIGLLAGTMARLYATASWAFGDTRTPLRCAAARVGVAGMLGWGAAMFLPGHLGIEPRWGVAGLSLASGVGALLEYHLLRRALSRRVAGTGLPLSLIVRLWIGALLAAAIGRGVGLLAGDAHPVVVAALVLPAFGLVYLGSTLAMRVPGAASLMKRLRDLVARKAPSSPAKTGP